MIRLILEKDGNAINDKDEDDNTPLHLGQCVFVGVIVFLLEIYIYRERERMCMCV